MGRDLRQYCPVLTELPMSIWLKDVGFYTPFHPFFQPPKSKHFVYVCVMCVSVCVHLHVHVCGGPVSFCNCSAPYFLKQILSLHLEISDWLD